jgi:hypothetical protein
MFDMGGDVGSIATDVEDGEDTYIQFLTILFFIPAIIHFLMTISMVLCCKKGGRAPLFLNMCFNYVMITVYCVVPGIILLFALINQDVCDVHMQMLTNQLNDTTIDFGSSSVTLGQTVESILTCSGSENIISIMGLKNELNITDDLSSTLDALDDAVDGFDDAFDSLDGTIDSMDSMIDALNVDYISASDLSSAKEDVSSLLDSLPDQNANLDDTEQQTKFTNMYSIDWTTYQSSIDAVNTIIVAMSPGNPLGGKVAFGNATTYTQSYFAGDTSFSCTGSCSGSNTDGSTYTYGNSDTYDDLDTAASVMDTYTDAVQQVVSINDEIVFNLTRVLKDINNINASIIYFPELQDDASLEFNDIDDALSSIGDGIDITDVKDSIIDIIDQVMTGDSYTGCAFIGSYYTGTYKGAFCEDFLSSLLTLGYLMLGNAILMFLTFCCSGYFAPYRRKSYCKVGSEDVSHSPGDVELSSMPLGNNAPPGYSEKL